MYMYVCRFAFLPLLLTSLSLSLSLSLALIFLIRSLDSPTTRSMDQLCGVPGPVQEAPRPETLSTKSEALPEVSIFVPLSPGA